MSSGAVRYSKSSYVNFRPAANHGTRSPSTERPTDTLRNCVHTNVGWSPRNGQTAGGDYRKSAYTWCPARAERARHSCRCALALALASGGGRVLLMEVEGRQGIAQLFDTPPLPYEERLVAVAPDGGEVFALAVDPEAALL